ncbi:Hypothetical predicted protein [Olea europaea subsp. europaea]|nr:Hypothetical predicted protein [Olea europaea subsp. europaea]
MEKNPQGQKNSNHNFEEFESNNFLRRLVKNGELEEGFRHLENMVYRGDIPDIIPCTSLIRGFCRIGKTKKATRIMEILEESGAVPDVITYNVLISGYCKSGEIDSALKVLDRMSVAPDVVTYNTILRTLCDSGKLKQAMKVLDRQLQKDCIPDVITYTILIEATCKESGVGQAMKLLDEMRIKGFTFPLNSSRLCICCAIKTGSNGSVVRSGQDSLSFASYMLRKLVVCPSFHGGEVMASRRRKILIFKVRIRVEMVIRGRFGRPDFGGHRASCWHFEDYSSFWKI